ncbi:MAG TPA: hypothetical protein VLI91_15170 [Roseiarcus sp.]|nr:hypothetical protein [Roseiarcus sp.]
MPARRFVSSAGKAKNGAKRSGSFRQTKRIVSQRAKQVLETIKAPDSAISPNRLFSMGSGSFRFAVFSQALFPGQKFPSMGEGALS